MKLKSNATNLRKNQTLAEQRLWSKLRNRQFFGYKFRRQMVMSGYIVDFIRHDPKIILELDGGQHAEQVEDDEKRTLRLQEEGYRAIRFWNNEVLGNMDGVLEVVAREMGVFFLAHPHPVLLPSREKGRRFMHFG